MSVEEEGKPRCKVVDVHAAGDAPTHVLQPVAEGECQLLRGGGTCLPDVVTGDRNRIPLRHVLRAEFHGVYHQSHRRFGREDIFLLRDEFFENVVLDGAAQLVRTHALVLGCGDIHRPDDRGRRVDGHARGHLIERNAIQQDLHILQRRDSNAALAEFPQSLRLVGVVAHQSREVEGDG